MNKSYKSVARTTTLSAAVSDGFAALEELGSEARDIVDNAGENLSQTQRITTFGETADALEGLDEPQTPNTLSDRDVTYSEYVHREKKASPSRAVRHANAVAMLQAAMESAQAHFETYDDAEENEETIAERDEVEEFINELDETISNVESCEFPGMFG